MADPYQQPIVTRTKVVIRSCIQKGTTARPTVVVRSDAGTPKGRARLTRDRHLVGVEPLQRGTARFMFSTSRLKLGYHKLRATYLPASGSNFQRSSGSRSFTVKRSCVPPLQGGSGSGAGHRPSGGHAYPGLPNTGGMAWWPLALALGCLGCGLALVASSRRRHHAR